MLEDRVDHVHAVATSGEPGRVHARASADVQHRCRRGRQVPEQQLASPFQLQATVAGPERPLPLIHTRVMREQIMCRHGSMLATSAAQCNASSQRSSAWKAPTSLE